MESETLRWSSEKHAKKKKKNTNIKKEENARHSSYRTLSWKTEFVFRCTFIVRVATIVQISGIYPGQILACIGTVA